MPYVKSLFHQTISSIDDSTFARIQNRRIEVTGIDFPRPLICKVKINETEKCYVVIFTCATSRAVHLELTHSQTAEEFQKILNSFITRKTRPRRIISDNATAFKTTASWIKKIQKSERLQNYLATHEIHWTFNLAKSPWWGGIYERLIQELKKTLYKTLGAKHLIFRQLRIVILDIERNMNNHPLTYSMSKATKMNNKSSPQTSFCWGKMHDEEINRMQKRLDLARKHSWQRWQKEYVHGLMEFHRITKG